MSLKGVSRTSSSGVFRAVTASARLLCFDYSLSQASLVSQVKWFSFQPSKFPLPECKIFRCVFPSLELFSDSLAADMTFSCTWFTLLAVLTSAGCYKLLFCDTFLSELISC